MQKFRLIKRCSSKSVPKTTIRPIEMSASERFHYIRSLFHLKVIADEDEKRTKEYERSVKKRLADVASKKALSEGERLAEYILEDLLLEAAIDLSK